MATAALRRAPGERFVADDRKTPVKRPASPAARSGSSEIDAFLAKAKAIAPVATSGRGRMIFALDATMSRQPTWDTAQQLQAEMFDEAGKTGALDVQLVYFRGFNECRASRWVSETRSLRDLMTGIECRAGNTQIGRVLAHARDEARRGKVNVLVFVGDAQEEVVDDLAAKAGELGLLGVRAFVFQEGTDPDVERAFRDIARLTGGAYARFDPRAAGQLAQLLRAAAAYAAGGLKALQKSGAATPLLLSQLR
jgi:hypothetical protein